MRHCRADAFNSVREKKYFGPSTTPVHRPCLQYVYCIDYCVSQDDEGNYNYTSDRVTDAARTQSLCVRHLRIPRTRYIVFFVPCSLYFPLPPAAPSIADPI